MQESLSAVAFAELVRDALMRRFREGHLNGSIDRLRAEIESNEEGPGLVARFTVSDAPGVRFGFRWTPVLDDVTVSYLGTRAPSSDDAEIFVTLFVANLEERLADAQNERRSAFDQHDDETHFLL